MKKFLALALILLAAVFAVSVVAGCASPPPPPPPPPAPPPPPPPPPVEEVLDTSPPEVTVSLAPQPFSPDGDGVDDTLTVKIHVQSATPVYWWKIEIREPGGAQSIFSEWEGEGLPPETLVWDGLSASGELVQSASNYAFGLYAANAGAGDQDIAEYHGVIEVDVLVRREGDVLRVIVPSIVFAPNSGEFIKGVDPEVAENNERILQRIAEVLGNFPSYKIKVEGHANPTTAPGTKARTNEETVSTRHDIALQPLSQTRAQAVVDYLADHGVEKERLTPIGMGGTRVVAEFTDKDNWWKNRRVEFILEKPAEESEPDQE